MSYGFLRVGAATPRIKIADCVHNRKEILQLIRRAEEKSCDILLLPELCLTGATCGDLFLFPDLIADAEESLTWLAKESRFKDVLTVVGLPYRRNGLLCNCTAGLYKGEVIHVAVKSAVAPEEQRFFSAFYNERLLSFKGVDIAVEIGAGVYAQGMGSGAALVLNPSAEYETAGAAAERRRFAEEKSLRSVCGYARAGAGKGESSTDAVYSGHNIIAEHGEILAETKPFEDGFACSDIDIGFIAAERSAAKMESGVDVGSLYHHYDAASAAKTESGADARSSYHHYSEDFISKKLMRKFTKTPFVPENPLERGAEVLAIQCAGLEQRLRHIGAKDLVLGFSGGLDSTLALIAAVKTFDSMKLSRKGICAVSMPCFGTSERTRTNARGLAEALGCTFMEIPITESVERHFKDIGHDKDVRDLVFENAQARERTQVIMDLAGKRRGIALGTGDMSELALGFATYNGDHMSMYGVNASVPKTLMPHVILSFAQSLPEDIGKILRDIIDTPVSPELLPPDEITGEAQETEKTVGPYILHDFFLYHFLWRRAGAEKILFVTSEVFAGLYAPEEIKKWLGIFMKRFYANQFKRSCLPDGPRVYSRSLSPRGGLVFPSDAACQRAGFLID